MLKPRILFSWSSGSVITLVLVLERQSSLHFAGFTAELHITSHGSAYIIQLSLEEGLQKYLLPASETSRKWIGTTSVKFFNF